MSQKRRCWTAAAICAILASGARVPALLGPKASPRAHDPFANAAAVPALHASFAVATEVTARGDEDGREEVQDEPADAGGPRPFTMDAIYAAVKADPLAVRAHGGVLIGTGESRSIGNPNGKAPTGDRAPDGAPHGGVNPELLAAASWGGGSIGPLAADSTTSDSSDPRRASTGGRHRADCEVSDPSVPVGPPPIIIPAGPNGFPAPIGVPAGGGGFPGAIGAPPPPAIHAVPLPAPLALGVSGLAFAAAAARKRLGLCR